MKALFFSPYAGILEHSRVEADLAECLQKFGYNVTRLGCDGFMSEICTVMTSAGLNFASSNKEKFNVCHSCRLARTNLLSKSEFKINFIEQFFLENSLDDKNNILANVNITNWHQLIIDAIPIGRFASYEFLLEHKIHPKDMTEKLWPQYFAHLEQCVLTYLALNNLLRSDKPDVGFVYNNLYSVNHIFESVLNLSGIPTYRIHGGFDVRNIHETVSISQGVSVVLNANKSEEWANSRQQILGKDQINEVFLNQMSLLKSKSVLTYSKEISHVDQNSIRDKYLISRSQKILICATSSADEMSALSFVDNTINNPENLIFVDQIDWLKDITEIAKRRSDYHILIRIHPREFPNHRDSKKSNHAEALINALVDLPFNVNVIWPSDDVSIYDLIKVVDVLLTGISSVGGEFLAFGIPVICHESSKLKAYPPECVSTVLRREDYEDLIDATLSKGVGLTDVVMYFRWKNFQFSNMSTLPLKLSLRRSVWQFGSNLYYSGRLRYLQKLPFIAWIGIRLFKSGRRMSLNEEIKIDYVIRNSLKSLMEVPPSSKVKIYVASQEALLVQDSVNKLRNTIGLNPTSFL